LVISRPKIDVGRNSLDNTLEVLSALGIIFLFYLVWHAWAVLPDRIPTHYNFSGQPDGWGGKGTLLILPIITLILFATFAILQRFPRFYNYPVPITESNAKRQYILARYLLGWLNFEIVWFFAYIEWRTVQVALGQAKGLGPAAVFVLLATTIGSIAIYIILAYKAK
jgi:uncharacterized membrane protein